MVFKFISFGYLAVAVMVFASWFTMFSGRDSSELLSVKGWKALRYYTVDSNLLMGIAAIVHLVDGRSAFCKILVLTGTATVTLTLLTVVCFLWPMAGMTGLFSGTNLYMHLIVPVAAVILLILNEGCAGLPLSSACWSALPTAVYSAFYLRNVIKKGLDYDWYTLAKGGPITYPFLCMGFIWITVLIAAFLWLVSGGCTGTVPV